MSDDYEKNIDSMMKCMKVVLLIKLFVFSSNRKSQLLTLKQGMKWLDVSIVYFVVVVLKISVHGILT